jgi:hypothetical protein
MPAKPFVVFYCARCDSEVGRVEGTLEDKGTPAKPAYYRQLKKKTAEGEDIEEKSLDTLCEKCENDVEELDRRIFEGGRVRKTKEGAST